MNKKNTYLIYLKLFCILFLLFLGLCLLFYFNVSNKCRNTKDFDFSSINKNKTYAVLMIDCGEIVIEINNNVSPNNSKRFLKLIDK